MRFAMLLVVATIGCSQPKEPDPIVGARQAMKDFVSTDPQIYLASLSSATKADFDRVDKEANLPKGSTRKSILELATRSNANQDPKVVDKTQLKIEDRKPGRVIIRSSVDGVDKGTMVFVLEDGKWRVGMKESGLLD